jgi:N-acetylglucosamine-6-phosphate deacetylase
MRKLFKNAFLILPPGGVSGIGFLCLQEGMIERIEIQSIAADFDLFLEEELSRSDEILDCAGDYLAPGLIDLHCHGALGNDAMEATTEAFNQILDFHAKRGTTLVVLSTVAASLQEMLAVLASAKNYQLQYGESSRLAGIHLEGPYFSPERRGAHRAEVLRHPSKEETATILNHASLIRRMTLAPELPGVLELIPELVRHGIAVSAGHSDATEAEAVTGFAAGISQATHLYNCMSSLHRSEGKRMTGLAEAALTTQGILCEVIADGVHLSPTLLRLAWLAKGWHAVAIVSDATAGVGLSEGEPFELGGLRCRIEEGAAWMGEGKERRLAGSCLTLFDGVRMMVEEAQIPIEEAVAMATLVPARSLKLDFEIGSLTVGKQANFVRFSENWIIKGVWIGGDQIT